MEPTWNEIHYLLHKLWTKDAGTKGYSKADWKRLEAILETLWREAKGQSPRVETVGVRFDVHGGADHSACLEPQSCDCDCHICKRTWFDAGRPSPKSPPALSIWDRLNAERQAAAGGGSSS